MTIISTSKIYDDDGDDDDDDGDDGDDDDGGVLLIEPCQQSALKFEKKYYHDTKNKLGNAVCSTSMRQRPVTRITHGDLPKLYELSPQFGQCCK